MAAVRDALRRAAASLALLLGFLHPAPASAASGSFTLGDQSVVQVVAGARSVVTVKAWDRPNVQFETDDEAVQVTRRPVTFGTPQQPLSVSIQVANIMVRDPLTGAETRGTLPPEEFPYASDFRPGIHDDLRILAGADTRVTVMVPASTGILETRIRGAGILTVDDYHGGTLFAVNGGGNTVLTDVMSSAFVQQMNGRLDVVDSSFDRLRARGNNAKFVFEHNRVRQIEVSTVAGSIVYDNGTFDPGLARFESTSGSIAIGVANGAQVAARSNDGHVYSMWDKRTPIEQHDNEANATIAGGGPVVNAVTERGNIFLYDGALDSRQTIPPEWRPVRQAMQPPRAPQQAPDAFQRFRALRGRTF